LLIYFALILAEGTSSVVAGSNELGNIDGVGMIARFNTTLDIAIDQQTGSLFVSDHWNHNIRKITPQGKFVLSSLLSRFNILIRRSVNSCWNWKSRICRWAFEVCPIQ
jgi:hypothetical protein